MSQETRAPIGDIGNETLETGDVALSLLTSIRNVYQVSASDHWQYVVGKLRNLESTTHRLEYLLDDRMQCQALSLVRGRDTEVDGGEHQNRTSSTAESVYCVARFVFRRITMELMIDSAKWDAIDGSAVQLWFRDRYRIGDDVELPRLNELETLEEELTLEMVAVEQLVSAVRIAENDLSNTVGPIAILTIRTSLDLIASILDLRRRPAPTQEFPEEWSRAIEERGRLLVGDISRVFGLLTILEVLLVKKRQATVLAELNTPGGCTFGETNAGSYCEIALNVGRELWHWLTDARFGTSWGEVVNRNNLASDARELGRDEPGALRSFPSGLLPSCFHATYLPEEVETYVEHWRAAWNPDETELPECFDKIRLLDLRAHLQAELCAAQQVIETGPVIRTTPDTRAEIPLNQNSWCHGREERPPPDFCWGPLRATKAELGAIYHPEPNHRTEKTLRELAEDWCLDPDPRIWVKLTPKQKLEAFFQTEAAFTEATQSVAAYRMEKKRQRNLDQFSETE